MLFKSDQSIGFVEWESVGVLVKKWARLGDPLNTWNRFNQLSFFFNFLGIYLIKWVELKVNSLNGWIISLVLRTFFFFSTFRLCFKNWNSDQINHLIGFYLSVLLLIQ